MRNSNLQQSVILALFLLVNTLSFSNDFNKSVTENKKLSSLFVPIINTFSPTSGTAGTVVTLTGSDFKNASVVTIGITTIAIQFISSTELKIIIPCGLASGDLAVDGISAGVFTSNYISPTITTPLTNLSYCIGTSVPEIILAGSPSGTTFNWTNSNASIGLITSESSVTKIPSFTAANSTLEPITSTITVTPTINGCLGEPKNYTIIINPLPVVTPISNISVCAGININQINLTASSPTTGTGTSFLWTGNNNTAIGLNTTSGTTSPIPAFTAVNSTSSTLSSVFNVTPTYKTCIGTPISFNINVQPQSNGGTLSGTTSVCSGQNSGNLTVSGIIGSIVRWEQSIDGTNWTSIANSSAVYTSGNLTTTTLFRVAVQNSTCLIAYSNTVTITVNSLPTIIGNLSVCSGATTTLNGSETAASANAWLSSNTSMATVSSTGLVTGISAGTPIITYTNSNGCKTTTTITVYALPAKPTLNAIQPDCTVATGTIQFSGLPTSGNWTINPGGYNGSGATYSLSNQLPGTYNFLVTDSNLCASLNAAITINTALIIPAIPAIGTITQPSCTIPSGSVVLNGLPSGNWTITKLPGGQTYTNSGSTHTILNLTEGTYTFSVSNGTCSSLSSLNVVIDAVPSQQAPTVGTILQPTCSVATGSVTLSGLPTGTWTLTRSPDGITLTSSGTTETILGLASETYNYTATNSNGCISPISNNIVIDNQPVSPSAPIANAQSFLTTDNATVSNLQIVSGAPTWYENSVILNAIPISTLLATGTYYASQTSINGCESTNRTAVSVSVFPTSVGGSVSGTTTVCSGINSTVLTLSGYTGSIQKWESSTVSDFSSNVQFINIQNATYTATNLTAPLYFRAVVLSGTTSYSSPAFIDVAAQSIGGNLTGSTSICSGQNSGAMTISGRTGTIARWEQSENNGATWTPISNISDTYTSGILLVTTQYRVVVQNGVCPEAYSSVVTITVNSTPTITDIPDQNICYGTTVSFGNPASTAGYTYEWSSLVGITPNPRTPDYTFTVTQSDTYTYTITNLATGCSVSDSFTITMKPLPTATVIDASSICEGNPISIGANSTIGSEYSWISNPVGFTSINSNPSVNPVVKTTYILEETIIATGCKNSKQVVVTVQPIPIITIVGSPQFNICETTTQVQIESSAVNYIPTSIVWSKVIGTGNFDFTNILNPKYSPSTADKALVSVKLRLTVTGNGPCAQTYSQDLEIIIDKKPIANAGLDVTTCGTNAVTMDASSTQNATSLNWSIVTNGITGILDSSNPYKPSFTPSANDVNHVGPITIKLEANSITSCSSTISNVSVLITKPPVVDAGSATATICEGTAYSISTPASSASNVVLGSINWVTGGDGSFSNPHDLNTVYTPGSEDITEEFAVLTLSGTGNSPCFLPATDTVILTIIKKPTVDLGVDKIVCQGPVNISSNIQNAGTILWTSNGNGNFIDATANSPIYIPAISDLNKPITFTAKVSPKNSCGPVVIDFVTYTINAAPTIIAGGDDVICQNETTYQLQATTNNTTSITWTTTGSGSFDNIHNEYPIYTLSPNDILVGSITFRITGTQSGCADDFDEMVLRIQKNPIANAGLAQIICQGDSVIIPGSATNSNTFSWTRTGGMGSFINNNTANPTYTSQLSESEPIYLTLTAGAIAPCVVSANSNTTITIVPKATAEAGADDKICEGDTYHVTSASSTNNIGLQWTGGDGTFTGDTTIDPIYTPGPNDISNGSVILTLIATKNFPCNANAVDKMTLTINKIPAITVINPDVDLCVGDPSYVINGVIPTNYDTLLWTTSGTGTFSPNNTSETPIYTPSERDYSLGTVILTLTASRYPLNCNSATSNTITLHFIKKPIANAGADDKICQGFSYVTNGASATNYSNVTWSTSGSGTFTSETSLLATYTPSSLDFDASFVDLTLSANTITPCAGTVTDKIRLYLQKLPVITVPSNTSICVNQNSFPIGGVSISPDTAYDVNSIKWTTTTATGYFSPSGDALKPFYNPSVDDYANGFADLTITVDPIAPCVTSVSKSFKLSFEKLPVASAGPNLTICDTPFHITTATTTPSTVNDFIWSTSGNGTFDYTDILDPIYTPGSSDAANSPITLKLTANAIAPCTLPSITTLQLNIIKSPTITVTPIQLPICEDTTNTTVIGTTVSDQSSYIWTSTTGTTINNPNTLNPSVTPSAADKLARQIVLTITATPNTPCTLPVSKTVTIPIDRNPVVNAGTSQTICEGTNITTSDATATFVDIAGGNLLWTNNGGDGSFITPANRVVTTYQPGPTEIANGSVNLKLTGTASSPCVINSVSTLNYTITKKPTLTIIPAVETICENAIYKVQPGKLSITNLSSVANITWSASSPGTITTSGTLDLEPTFSPSAADIFNNYSILTVTITPVFPCATPITGTIRVDISKKATIDATHTNYTFCENIPKQLTAVFGNHDATTILWRIVSGAGTLTPANSATPLFTPDASSTTVLIEVSVQSNSPCTAKTTEQFTLNVIKKPVVSFTKTTATICNTQTLFPLDVTTVANATTNTTYKWTTTGTGNFVNDTAITSPNNYNFSASDLLSNSVTLRLTAYADPLCSSLSTYKEITITIDKAPTATISSPLTICAGEPYTATATNPDGNSVSWIEINGNHGAFVYGILEDIATFKQSLNNSSDFEIQLTSNTTAACAAKVVSQKIKVQPKPTIDVGIKNRYNCSGQTYQITGVTGQSLGIVSWTSNSGVAPGTFSNPTALNPSYTPSATELTSGNSIILTVTAQAVAPCTDIVTDFIILTLTPNQDVNAGLNQTICEGSKVSLAGSATYSSSVNWTSSGDGTFSAPNSLTSEYIPGASDLINESVTLTLHAISNTNCPEVTDSTVITIVKKPTVSASDIQMCINTTGVDLNGTGTNYDTLSWSIFSGPGYINSGRYFTDLPTSTSTTYAYLRLVATHLAGCTVDADATKIITVIIQSLPEVNAGTNGATCYIPGQKISPFSIIGSSVAYASSSTWATNSSASGKFNSGNPVIYESYSNSCTPETLTLTANGIGACSATVVSDAITLAVNCTPPSLGIIGGSSTLCQGTSSVVYTVTPNSNVQTYNWQVPTGATIVSGQGLNSITVDYGANAVSGKEVKVNGINGCGSGTSSTLVITVNQRPTAGTISGPQTVCVGTSNTYTATAFANADSYKWKLPDGSTASTTTNAIPILLAINGDLSVTGFSNSCGLGDASANYAITVIPLPTLTSLAPTPICSNSIFNYQARSSDTGATITWTRAVQGGISNIAGSGNGLISETLLNTKTVAVNVNYEITITTANGCTKSETISVTVNPIPSLTSGTPPTAICSNGTFSYAPTSDSSGNINWKRATLPGILEAETNGTITSINTTISESLTNTTSSPITVIYKVTLPANSLGCVTIIDLSVVVNPLPIATIAGTNSFTVCQNATQPSVTFTGSNGTPPYNFSYEISNGSTGTTLNALSTSTSNSVSVPIPTATVGNYIVTLLSVQDSSATSCSNSLIKLPSQASINVEQGGIIIPQNTSIVSQKLCEQTSIDPIVFDISGSATNSYATGLPAGLDQSYNTLTNTFTISGTALATGTFNYTVYTSGSINGCDTTYNGTITVNSDDVITLLTPNTNIQDICAGTTIQPIAYNLGGGATGGIVDFYPRQPVGISWVLISNVLTISGTSTEVGTFAYAVNSFGICDPTTYSGTIKIKENAIVKLVSENATPTVCIDISLGTPSGTAIQYGITSTNSATMVLTGVLPNGVSFDPTTEIFSGTPRESGSFPYTISSSTTCGNLLIGTITVNPLQSISLLSGTINQIACVNSAIDPINFSLSSGVTGVTIDPAFPPGITSIVNNGVLTISGIPTTAQGNKNYIIKTVGGCGPAVTTNIFFEIKSEATIVFESGSGAISQSVCQSSAIKPITFTIGGGAEGIEVPIWPAGLDLLTLTKDTVTGVYTLSGNPTANGTFTIPITTTGCITSETITISNVNTAVSINLTSTKGTDNQTQCQTNFNTSINPIKYLVVGATGIDVRGLPSGVVPLYNAGTGELIISGIPTESGVFNYSVSTLPCTIIKTGVLKISTPISITNEVVTDVSCSSINNGAISLNIIGGVTSTGLYAINWSGPNGFQQNLTRISGLGAGEYTISGKDAIGCTLPTKKYTILPAQPIIISLVSTTNVTCNNSLGCANFSFSGGSEIFGFSLQYRDPSSQILTTIVPQNNNYYNICNLKAGLYYLTVVDSKNCSTTPYQFSIYDFSILKIDTLSLDSTLCVDTAGKIRVTVTSLDENLAFYYNSTLVSNVNLGKSTYELSITNPTIPSGVIKVVNSQNCSDTKTISTSLINPDLDFTSLNLETNGNVSVNESVKFTNGLTNSNMPAEYNYVVWDFGDNSPYKVFYNPIDIVPNSLGESIATVFHTYAIDGLFSATFTVYNSFGCSRSITKIITVGKGAEIIVPTAFSPNQDGINDLFRPMLLGLKEVNMNIYDNLGNLVYEISSETELLPTDWGWNGIEKTRNIPINGTYRYYIISKTIDDKTIEKAGQFMLIK